jgi:hypothetical protein
MKEKDLKEREISASLREGSNVRDEWAVVR